MPSTQYRDDNLCIKQPILYLPRLAGFYREGRSPFFFLVIWGGVGRGAPKKAPRGLYFVI